MYGSKTSVKLYLLMPDLCCWAELHTAALRALVLARQWIANSSLLLKLAALKTGGGTSNATLSMSRRAEPVLVVLKPLSGAIHSAPLGIDD